MTKDMLKQLIKEVITETSMRVADYNIYKDFYSDKVSHRTTKGITNAYKSIVMYARRIEEPRIRNNPESLKKEKLSSKFINFSSCEMTPT